MISGFVLTENRLHQISIQGQDDFRDEMIWIDLVDPTDEERELVEEHFKLELPEKAEIKDIEASARFYEDEDGLHVHSFFLNDFDNSARNITVAFSIKNNRLFTIHEEDLSAFRLYRLRARQVQLELTDGKVDVMNILIGLHETAIEHVADVLERIYAELENTSPYVLALDDKESEKEKKGEKRRRLESQDDESDKEPTMEEVLQNIALQEDMNGKARLSLMDTRRSFSFLMRTQLLSEQQKSDVREILQDLESLTGHTTFLFDKVNFLLDAATGKISLEQSRIIKIFSIASVVFLPPTLIASIYGMNFPMPELNYAISYPLSIGAMILSGIAPYLLFKRKGWL
ncbi:magnesium/cobalt transporter CorA [Ignatzschineria cameli]|uniref:Magnesium transport protein CorA n=1 Tax=Ignatzschineria cameli TaxID=2182793 RepID=A0A2U2AKX1_9GAMM|nr:magnesium/cobalt transporter CorA [Ignatzschineria cameli]PWD83814.1 magnesium and cobalt transport protein CorA [Ignatzschineria cameli]PWD86104.1 magnesium and cobalt transport protein CorA [Ignatzschineria cameli]PWD88385.1 magnesium and cobalt transport protein CorA [Ignatzschineria cameli]PWD88911.1 magnesium and cobalt transport protein CorA [Ignatzschineria cameli]PWD89628.1 magnesium and cobalt transport protein CorA [Ignatzschineria cameli]